MIYNSTMTDMNKKEVLQILREQYQDLSARFGVDSLTLFGSVARGEAGPGSDIDLLVEFSHPIGLFKFIELKQRLESILGCKVDLATPRSLKPYMKDKVLQEAVRVS